MSKIDEFIDNLYRRSDSTKQLYRHALTRLDEYTDKELSTLEKNDIEDWIDEMRVNLKNSTVNQYLIAVKQFYKYLKRNIDPGVTKEELRNGLRRQSEFEQIINIDPLERVDTHGGQAINKSDIETLLHASKGKTHHRRMFVLFLYFGLRKAELLGLKTSSIDYNNREIKIERETTKNVSSVRTLPYSPEIDEFMETDEKYLLGYSGHGYSDSMPNMACQEYDNLVEGKLYPHRFRITFNSYMIENDVDDFVIKKLMGHATDRDMTDYYHGQTKQLEEDMRRAMTEDHFLLPILREVREVER